jgi:hypothetical protein
MNDSLSAQRAGLDPLAFSAVAALRADMDTSEVASSLPSDHPAWQRDVFSISSRAKAIIATIRPIVVKALTFWDHQVRTVTVGARALGIDPSGCYRLR